MCGRLNQFASIPSLSLAGKALRIERRKKKEREDKRSEAAVINNICPTDYADVLALREDEWEVERMRFGLIPRWAKGGKKEVWKKFRLTFNSRSETLFDLASYRQPIRKNRCLSICKPHLFGLENDAAVSDRHRTTYNARYC